jgi:hypothetical protein
MCVRWCYVALHPVHTSNDMRDHCKGLKATCMAKSPEHVFCQVVEVVNPTVVHTGGNLNVFPCHLCCICHAHCNRGMDNCYRYYYEEGVHIREGNKKSANCKGGVA